MLMRTRLAAARKKTDSAKKALCRLGFEKYTHVSVQSLHMIPGIEYDELLDEIESAKHCGAPTNVKIGLPLLHGPEDIADAVQAIIQYAPQERTPDEAVVWVGHGTKHDAGKSYELLTQAVQQLDPRIFIGTLSGAPDIEKVLALLHNGGIQKAWLMPLLSIVGKHAKDSIAGEAENSWRTILEQNGIACRSVLQGAIEYEGFASIWLNHLQKAAKWQ
jgi:sirohydrochlorin cobaltochelatase